MAIILLDNLIDILMHRYCLSKFSYDEFTMRIMPPEFSEKEISDAKDSIQGKIKVLRKKIKKLTKKEETIVTICHSYRNGAQHNDEHNPETIIVFAKILFQVVCDFFVRLQNKGHSAYYNGTPSWASRYISGNHVNYRDFSKVVVLKVSKGIRVSLNSVKNDLAFDLQNRLEEVDRMIEYDLPELKNKDKDLDFLFKMYEFEQTNEFKELTKRLYGLRYKIHDQSISKTDFQKEMGLLETENLKARTNFTPNIRFTTFIKLKSSIQKIKNSKNMHETLRTYERLNTPLEMIESFIIRAAEEWEEEQQLQLDIARGK
ncbi:MAG: hypothetical protein V4504_01090 [Patescibacteria group bacterium]